MTPAPWPRDDALSERLLVVDPRARSLRGAHVGDLPRFLRRGDLLVVNDAATLPASLSGRAPGGEPVEARLVGAMPSGAFHAVLFGGGDWRTPTERRPSPVRLTAGERLEFAELSAVVESVSPHSARLVELRFDREGAALWSALYRAGRPVQYSYSAAPLELWHVQVGYGSRPWAVEMPSAGRPLRWELLFALLKAGVKLASVTHAAGLSSTGDPALDQALPLPERFEIPSSTASAVAVTRAGGGRIVAVGTSVVRALEGAAEQNGGSIVEGSGVTDLVLGPDHRPLVVDGLLTGVHRPTDSHYALLRAFASAELLARASSYSERSGYLSDEFGDSWLLLASRAAARRQPDSGMRSKRVDKRPLALVNSG